MKRSKAIQIISNCLENFGLPYYKIEDYAEGILFEIEEAGMLPPLTDNLANGNGKGYGWESENES